MKTDFKQKLNKTAWNFGAFSFKICLTSLLLISMGLSSSFWYDNSELLFSNAYSNSQQVSQKKDISEFGKRLSERLKGVFGELVVLTTKWKLSNFSSNSGSVNSFSDTQDHEYRYFIDLLAKSNIIQWAGNKKFYPENYMRMSDFIKILVNTYRYKVWYDISADVWLSDDIYIIYDKNAQSQKYINTAYKLWFLNNISTWIISDLNFDKILTTREISKIFDNINNQYPGMLSWVLLDVSDLYTKRGECSKYIIQAFQINQNKNIETENSLATSTESKSSLLDNITKAIKNYYLQS